MTAQPQAHSEPVSPYNPRVTLAQRDRVIARCDALDDRAERLWFRAPVGHEPRSVERFRRVANRLRLRMAGCRDGAQRASRIWTATERYVRLECDEAEWLDRLRWLGLDARAGHTRLSPAAEYRRELHVQWMQQRQEFTQATSNRFAPRPSEGREAQDGAGHRTTTGAEPGLPAEGLTP